MTSTEVFMRKMCEFALLGVSKKGYGSVSKVVTPENEAKFNFGMITKIYGIDFLKTKYSH